ncbi:MAG: hypothetical protein AMJ95_08070 [Omnitrophica WOR_2 bacterium SM23_72]|nr:MAG: hypothetical protein AMJ95_08070 [Omnitrophica WOR_2 bacterium SM23_72]
MNQQSGHNPDSSIRIFDALILLIFALLLRLLFLPCGWNLSLGGDESNYWQAAISIASGKSTKLFIHPPLWGFLLSFVAVLSKNPSYARLFTTLISSLAVPLVYFIGTRSFSRKVGIIAGVMYSLYPNNIGFSHYLWAETLFALLVLASTYFFFETIYEKVKSGRFYLSIFLAALGLLAKEFAVILFASFMTLLGTFNFNKKKRALILATIIFLAPAMLYSTWASVSTRKIIILANAYIKNLNDRMRFSADTREEYVRFLLNTLEERFRQIPKTSMRELHNLWQPNSYTVHRLLYAKDSEYGNYHSRHARGITYWIVGFYIFVVLTGLTGICFGDNTPFRLFAISNMVYLSLLSILFFLVSRYRIPFIFIFILYSAAVISDPRAILKKLRCWRRVIVWAGLVLLFIHIVVEKWPNLGYLG